MSRPRSIARLLAVLGLVVGALHAPGPVRADGFTVPDGFVDEPVVGGLNQPVNLAVLPDGRTFVIERFGKVRLVVDGAFAPVDPILLVDSLLADDGERGLLGIAVDPDWPTRPYVYLDYNHADGPTIRISRYRASGDLDFTANGQVTLDPASRHDVLRIRDLSNPVHNGGSLHFGPDGMLFVAVGDDNVPCYALDLSSLRGKILRLDVRGLPDVPGGIAPQELLVPPDNPFAGSFNLNMRLVWAYGLRNPYSFAIDPLDGSLFIADVGAASYEEIDHAAVGGLNFQWPIYEGPLRTGTTCEFTDSNAWTPPVVWYDRTAGAAVIAGFVYRRPPGAPVGFPLDHEGSFFFTDFYFGWVRRLVPGPGGSWVDAPAAPGQPGPIYWANNRLWVSAFLQAPDGSVLYTQNWTSFPDPNGQLRRIRRAFVTGVDPGSGTGPALTLPRPQPSRGEVRLGFHLAAAGPVRLSLHDVRGRLVRVLIRSDGLPAGDHVATWDGRDARGARVGAGVYRLRLEAGETIRTRPLVRLATRR
jgi:glucose/arabinose dehydrogenase